MAAFFGGPSRRRAKHNPGRLPDGRATGNLGAPQRGALQPEGSTAPVPLCRYHHGQIKLALKASGRPLTDEEAGGLTWGVWMRKT